MNKIEDAPQKYLGFEFEHMNPKQHVPGSRYDAYKISTSFAQLAVLGNQRLNGASRKLCPRARQWHKVEICEWRDVGLREYPVPSAFCACGGLGSPGWLPGFWGGLRRGVFFCFS